MNKQVNSFTEFDLGNTKENKGVEMEIIYLILYDNLIYELN